MIGGLDIALDTAEGAPRWRLTPTGGGLGTGWAIGRRAEEVAALMPRLFNLCAGAHAQAARAALGLPADEDAARAARRERARDHAVALLCDWPSLLGHAPDRAALAGLANGSEDSMRRLRDALMGGDIDLAGGSIKAMEHWLAAGHSPTARLLAHFRATLDPAWGRAELAMPDAADIAAALDAGEPTSLRETTAADPWSAAPLLRDLHAREGASLFLRLLARLLDLVACLDGAPEAPLLAPPGLGLARAARGLLAHRARVVGGLVADYCVLSPSAWNLAPGGLLSRMLAALPMSGQTPMLARLVVSCVNPCVPVTLRMEQREVAHA
ncbi:hypothetical protein [Ancylobacter polymorphus]|uniref:Hydrogenase expression/formation protein HupK n=1 Tax=Ancylobacter polymorphus TaxID=223390 RepID=A0A9E6ZZ12_9HYPH|nr:hypothetical protein [Ancylobacter polymorphus]UOK69955.1 hypothetical protein K9D25_14580 [Ancylobacter polymorphus]